VDAVDKLLGDVRKRIEWFDSLCMVRTLTAKDQVVYRSLLAREEELLGTRVPAMG